MNKHTASSATLFLLMLASTGAAAAPNIYVPLGDANSVQIVDTETSRAVNLIEDVPQVHGLAVTPDGRFLVAGSFMEVPDDAGATPPKPSEMSAADHERHHAKDALNNQSSSATSYVSIIDTASGQVMRRIGVRGAVHHVAISPDGLFGVTTHPGAGAISVIDLSKFEPIHEIQTGKAPNYATFTKDSRRLFVSNAGGDNVSEIDVQTWSISKNWETGKTPEHIVLADDDDELYVNNVGDGTVSVLAIADGASTRTFTVGDGPHGIGLSDDGETLFVALKDEGQVVALDLSTGNLERLSLTPAPYHLTAVEGRGIFYVSSRAEPRIWVVDQKAFELLDEVQIAGIGHQMVMAPQ